MTYRISKTVLERQKLGDFAARAATHAIEMKEWRAHMARVAEDDKNGVTGIEKHMAHPRPIAHPLIDAAVNEKDELDYEIIDDGPTAEQILRAQKDHLLGVVQTLEQDAIRQIAPHGRMRMLNFREADILKSDTDRFSEFVEKKQKAWDGWAERQSNKGFLKKAGDAIGITKAEAPPPEIDVHAEVTKTRSPEDVKHLEEQAERRARIESVIRAGAQAQHDIEDLTAETIGDWKAPDFKGI